MPKIRYIFSIVGIIACGNLMACRDSSVLTQETDAGVDAAAPDAHVELAPSGAGSVETKESLADLERQREQEWAQILKGYDFSEKRLTGVNRPQTQVRWRLFKFDDVEVGDGKSGSLKKPFLVRFHNNGNTLPLFYWQAVAGEGSVFALESKDEFKAEIRRRVDEDDAKQDPKLVQGCMPGMMRAKGGYAGHGSDIEEKSECLDSNWEVKKLCNHFKPRTLDKVKDPGIPMDFCIDRYEFPNVKGEFPANVIQFSEAAAVCETQGKRLCTEDEWTFACEGNQALPYPHGFDRYMDPNFGFDPEMDEKGMPVRNRSPRGEECNNDTIDKPKFGGDHYGTPKFANNSTLKHQIETIDKMWAALPSGTRTACKSEFGVYDLTGNVDEWTLSRHGLNAPKASILKGGFWGAVRTRCRPQTREHDDGWISYQVAFRCCANVKPSAQK